jgi:glyoxylase-like metal-dependent hydrolase (beta-lactamase superfamily II)
MLSIEQIVTNNFSLLSYIIHNESTHECLIIDPPQDIARRVDLDSLRIKTVINTHIHPDHTMGNRGLANMAPVLAHPGENTWFLRSYNTLFTFLLTGRFQPRISFTLSENARIILGDTDIEVLHTPGHSPGSICLYWDGNLISGDTIFAEGIGRTDIPGGNMAHLKKSITRIMDLPDNTLIWPGHSYGNKMKATLAQIRPFLSWVITSL